MSARKIKGAWYIDFRFEGRRIRKKSIDNSKQGALAYEQLIRARLARGESAFPKAAPDTEAAPLLTEFAPAWLRGYAAVNNKLSEQQTKESVLRNHIVPSLGDRPLDDINARAIERFKDQLLAKGLSPKSVNNILSVLNKLLRTAVEWELIPTAPRVRWMRTTPPPPKYLADDDVEALLGTQTMMEWPWHDMARVALHTGLRLGELLALRIEDIDRTKSLLTVRRSIGRGTITTPKNHRIRHLPIAAEIQDVLDASSESSGWIFDQPDGTHFRAHHAAKGLYRMCDRAGLDRIGWHVLRHTFATRLVSRGAPIRVVQELLGHASITMTERYSHVSAHTKREALALLSSKAKLGTMWAPMAGGQRDDRPVGSASREIPQTATRKPTGSVGFRRSG